MHRQLTASTTAHETTRVEDRGADVSRGLFDSYQVRMHTVYNLERCQIVFSKQQLVPIKSLNNIKTGGLENYQAYILKLKVKTLHL